MLDHRVDENVRAADPFAQKAEAELDAAGKAGDQHTRVWHLNRAAEYATLSERRRTGV